MPDYTCLSNAADYPRRIVCLTEETTETIYLLGEQDRIVGVSGYTVRPPEARLNPKVSAFTTAKFEKIMAVEPDLVLTFSDLQADIARELIVRGVPVMAFNQRSVPEILAMMVTLARVRGCEAKGREIVGRLTADIQRIACSANSFPYRPRVFFEEWKQPLIFHVSRPVQLSVQACWKPSCRILRMRPATKRTSSAPKESRTGDSDTDWKCDSDARTGTAEGLLWVQAAKPQRLRMPRSSRCSPCPSGWGLAGEVFRRRRPFPPGWVILRGTARFFFARQRPLQASAVNRDPELFLNGLDTGNGR